MRRVLVLAAAWVAFAACHSPLDPTLPREYACNRDAGLNSCPGGWRCGLGGFCENPAIPQAYACETDQDCVGGWHCGVEGTCYSVSSARDVRCRRDAGVSDCAPGWGCGPDDRCRDLTNGQAYSCAADTDCAQGWRCGVIGSCHLVDAGAPYQCTSDLDCEAGWRCGLGGTCVDVAGQGLSVDVSPFISRDSPQTPLSVDAVATKIAAMPGSDFSGNLAAWAADGGISVIRGRTGGQYTPWRVDLPAQGKVSSLAFPPTSAEQLYYADSTGLWKVQLFLPPQSVLPYGDGGLTPPASFRDIAYDNHDWITAFNASDVFIGDPPEHPTLPAGVTIRDLAMVDATYIGNLNEKPSVLLGTQQGLYFAAGSAYGWQRADGGFSNAADFAPISLTGLPGNGCGGGTAPGISMVAYSTGNFHLGVLTDDGQLRVYASNPSATVGLCYAPFDPIYGPCTPCPQGETLVAINEGNITYSLADGGAVSTVGIASICTDGTVTHRYDHGSEDGGCGLNEVPLPFGGSAGYLPDRTTGKDQGMTAAGMFIARYSDTVTPLQWSERPSAFAGGPDLLIAFPQIRAPGVSATSRDTVQAKHIAAVLDGGGLLPDWNTTYNGVWYFVLGSGSVEERPDLGIVPGLDPGSFVETYPLVIAPLLGYVPHNYFGANAAPTTYASLDTSSDVVANVFQPGLGGPSSSPLAALPPAHAHLIRSANSDWMVVALADRVWSDAWRDEPETYNSTQKLTVRLSPVPFGTISSMALMPGVPPTTGEPTPILEGYLVDSARLFRVTAASPTVWYADEIRIPGPILMNTWLENGRGRVGSLDGRVFSLPIPAEVADPIPEAPLPTVLDYSDLCGQAFALSPSRLYKLAPGTPKGQWQPVSLNAAFPGIDGWKNHFVAPLHKARVGNVDHLYAYSSTGLLFHLSATCSP